MITPKRLPHDDSKSMTATFDGGGSAVVHRLFTRDGKVVAPAPSASQNTGVGEWLRTGEREFAITFVAFNRDPTGNPIQTVKVRVTVTTNQAGDELQGKFQNEIYDLNGNLLAIRTGTVHGLRIQVQALQ